MDSLLPHAHENNTPLTQCCTVCLQSFPGTSDFFYPKRSKLNRQCKRCYNERAQPRKDKIKAQQQVLREEQSRSIPAGQKQCLSCDNILPATAEFFHHNKKSKDGFCERCKQCRLRYMETYHAAHREKRNLSSKAYYQDHKEELSKKNREYQIEHREEIRGLSAKYYEENHEAIMRKKAAYREANRERLKQYYQTPRGIIAKRVGAHNRRALKRSAQGKHTTEELYQQLRRQKNKCYYCHKKLGEGRNNWNADHVVPLSRGGSNFIDNIVIACPPCNNRKFNRLPHEWDEGGRLL